ncbi:MAG TPA: phosphotransferase [Croceibacterium sp.]|nr:phosphotransferase [Croceibacterium sp.]
MSARWEELVPEALHDAVRAAFSSTYGNTPIECLGAISGGASGAVVLRVRSGAHAHLLRVEVRRLPMRNPHQYTCMAIAAEARVAPALHYANAEHGVALMDYVEQVPLARFPGGEAGLARALGALAAQLQAAPAFPAAGDWRAIVGRLVGHVETLCAPGLLDGHRAGYERLSAATPWDAATHVPSHNDPNARNLLFDGERVWLIDWEASYRNDPMIDVAIMADNLAASPELEAELLRAWLGRAADAGERHRLRQVQAMTRLYYAALLVALSGPQPGSIRDLAAPSRAEFEAAVLRGEHAPTSPATMLVLGKMQLAGFLEGLARCEA